MSEPKVIVERDSLKLEFDQEKGTLAADRQDGAIGFGPLVCRAKFRDAKEREYDTLSSLADGWKAEEAEIDTPLGKASGFKAALLKAANLPADLVWEGAPVGGDSALFRLTLSNVSDAPLKITNLSPLGYRGADPGLEMGAGYSVWRFYRTGYQSWTPAGSIGVMEPDYKPRFFLPSRSGTNTRTPYSRKPGEKASDWMAQLVEPQLNLGALMGFITGAKMNSRVEMEVRYDRFRRLEAVSDGEKIMLDPGASISSEWLLFSLSRDPLAQQADYYDKWGQAMQARKSKSYSGWCTWYYAFWNVKETDLDANLLRLRDAKDLVEVFQLDDGFEPCVGEWLEWNKKFPTPPAEMVRRVKAEGFMPGLWLAPFLAARGSEIAVKHPDWILRNDKGRKVVAFLHPAWKGHVIYALDTTNPEMLKWLKSTIKTLVNDYGFRYLKLDFLYAAALPGRRHDKKATGAAALRRGLEAIREAAGEDTYLLGCGCPLGPAVGLVDGMRVSQDVDIRWKIPLMDFVSGIPTGPGAKNCFRNNLARALMHGRLWANDPDCVVLRDATGGMAEHEMHSELTLYYLSGGANFLSENVGGLPPHRYDWFLRSLPVGEGHAVPLDLFKKDFPELFVKKGKDSLLVALFNWEDQPRRLELDIAALGLAGSWHAFEYWDKKHLGATAGKLDLGTVPTHGVKYLRLVPADGRPRLLGTDLHMGMGELGVESEETGEGLKIKISLPGKRIGKVWSVLPGGKTVVTEVELDGEWEGTLG